MQDVGSGKRMLRSRIHNFHCLFQLLTHTLLLRHHRSRGLRRATIVLLSRRPYHCIPSVPVKMQNVELNDYPKETNDVSTKDVDGDSDLAQVPGKNYDPAPDQRDMRRLGKRQELKVCTYRLTAEIMADLPTASFPLLLHCWLCDRIGFDLGVQSW